MKKVFVLSICFGLAASHLNGQLEELAHLIWYNLSFDWMILLYETILYISEETEETFRHGEEGFRDGAPAPQNIGKMNGAR